MNAAGTGGVGAGAGDVDARFASPAPWHQSPSFPAVAGIVLVALALRPALVSVGPTLDAISREFGLLHWQAGMLTTIPDVLMGALALPAPWLARRLGRDRLVMAALLLLGISIFARAMAPGFAGLLAATVGVGAAIAVAGTLVAGFIKSRFASRASLMVGVYSTALSLGSTLSAAVTGPLVAAHGGSWRVGLGIWAVPVVLAVAGWWFAVRQRAPGGAAQIASSAPAHVPWRNRIAWRMALFFALVNLDFYALLTWIVPMFRESGYPPQHVGWLLACFTGMFMLASPVAGFFSRSLDRRIWLVGCAALAAGGLTWMALAPNVLPFASIAATALGLGGAFTLGMTLPLDHTHDAPNASAWTAFVLTVGYLIAAIGPYAVGALRDLTGSFGAPFSALALLTGAMAVLATQLRAPEHAGAARLAV